MKVCVLSESSADEAGIRLLVEALLGGPTEPVSPTALRGRGWTSVFATLPAIIKHLHFQTDAEALVVIVDSDRTPIHHAEHDEPGGADAACRLCSLRALVTQTWNALRQRTGQPELKIALGLAVPSIEGWYLCGRDHQVGEVNWRNGQKAGKPPYAIDQLKRRVYGTDKPPITLETECAVREVQRILEDLTRLESAFPDGFGALARTIRAWRDEPGEPHETAGP